MPIMNQKRELVKESRENGDPVIYVAHIRHDDECKNGHETFAITVDTYGKHRQPYEPTRKTASGRVLWWNSGGCDHETFTREWPDLAHLVRWHLCSTEGPMHYKANALYWAGLSGWCDGKPNSPPNVEHFKSTVVWGAVPDEDHGSPWTWPRERLETWLERRKARVQAAFRADVEAFGFKWSEPAEVA